jgi:hypothetical protein
MRKCSIALTTPRAALFGFVFAGLAAGGCVAGKRPDVSSQSNEIAPAATDLPHVVTDLSSLSPAETVAAPVTIDQAPRVSKTNRPGPSRNEEVTHKLAATASSSRYDPNAPPKMGASRTRLLNDKARHFANFSDILLAQTLQAAEQLAPEKLERHRVPEDLNPVVLTAILDPQGRLREIVIEQHSGDVAVDKLFIEACKKGCWSRNPPVDAHYSDGTYHLRISGTVFNVSFDRYGEYTYDTEIGLAIL